MGQIKNIKLHIVTDIKAVSVSHKTTKTRKCRTNINKMSMLAESRSRQKWSHDPRNTNWANDKTKFGYTMLTKMGWSEGSGLGLNLSGNVSHIKVNKRGSNAGVGLKKSHEDDWISHQDDFNALLNSLNGNPTSETASPVEKMRASKHRYTKFVKSKDLSNASTDDLACIFGQRGKTGNEVAEEEEDTEGSETEVAPVGEELSLKTVESTLSMSEYFAQKMAALKQKNVAANSPICMSNIANQDTSGETEGDGEIVKKKKKKKKEELEDTVTEVEVLVETCEPVKKKKKKKKVSNDDDENRAPSPCSELNNEGNELDRSDCEVSKKKKKKKKTEDSVDESLVPSPSSKTTSEDGNTVDPSQPIKKKKKKKKSKENIDEGSPVPSPCPAVEINELNDVDAAVAKKKKKSKKSKDCDDENSVPSSMIVGNEVVDLVLETGLVTKKKRKHTELVELCEEQTAEGVIKKKKKKKNKEIAPTDESNQ